jgi:hypothetical protein
VDGRVLCSFQYTDASTTGTLLTTVTADASVLVTAPFPLYLFGTSATQISVDHDGVIIFPTDTIYALGCSVNSPKAIDRIARIKGINHTLAQQIYDAFHGD